MSRDSYAYRMIYGFKEKIIGIHEGPVKCPSCESHQEADMMIVSHYSHMYWVPFCPSDKTVTTFCKKCGLKRYGLSFNQNLLTDYEAVKKNFRHPWYLYIGAGLLSLLGLAVVVNLIF